LLGDQLRFLSGVSPSFRAGEVDLDEEGAAHDFRAKVRSVPATERPKLLACSSFSLFASLDCGSSSSADKENRALANIFLFAFLETRRKSSMFAECTLSLTLTLVSEGREITCSEKVRLIVEGSELSAVW
jgi:hypothetical protein